MSESTSILAAEIVDLRIALAAAVKEVSDTHYAAEERVRRAVAEGAALRHALQRMIEFPVGHPSGPCIAECEDPANCFWTEAEQALKCSGPSSKLLETFDALKNEHEAERNARREPLEEWCVAEKALREMGGDND